MRKILLMLIAEYVVIRLERKRKADYDKLTNDVKIKDDNRLD